MNKNKPNKLLKKIKYWWNIKKIPKNTSYCYKYIRSLANGYKVKQCPYHQTLNIYSSLDNKEIPIEYCNYLDSELSIQDSVKECEIE